MFMDGMVVLATEGQAIASMGDSGGDGVAITSGSVMHTYKVVHLVKHLIHHMLVVNANIWKFI